MFERILIPLDGSPRAELILGQIGRILRREDSEILLLRVVRDRPDLPRGDAEQVIRDDHEESQRYIHQLVKEIALQGVKVHGCVAEGPPAETILDQAGIEGATMVAMSTHGRSGLSRWVLGSVAEKVARACPIPVLLVRSFGPAPERDPAPSAVGELHFRKILLPTDGSTAASEVLDPARKFAQLFNSEILVVHAEAPTLVAESPEMAVPPAPSPTPSGEDPITEKVAERFRRFGLAVERRTVVGDAAGVILDQSHEAGVDLVAMSTHGRTGLSRWLLGSVTEKVLRSSDVPLLVVRAAKATPPRRGKLRGVRVGRT